MHYQRKRQKGKGCYTIKPLGWERLSHAYLRKGEEKWLRHVETQYSPCTCCVKERKESGRGQ